MQILCFEVVSLDAMLESETQRERSFEDEQTYFSSVLSEIPEEDTRFGYYNGKPADLVTLFRR